MTDQTVLGVDAFGLTDVGKVRTRNEDHFVIASVRKSMELHHTSIADQGPFERMRSAEARLFVVADGVGGRPGGELASGTAVQALLEYMAQIAGSFNNLDVDREQEFLDRLEDAVHQAHQRILRELGAGGHGPATTLTMVMLVMPRAYVVHVGDSRAYYLHAGRLRQITRDQTTGQYMVDLGAWTEAQAARAGAAANLTSSVGGSDLMPAVGLVDLEPGDVLLLCTDGLTKHVPDDRIATVLGEASGGAEAACRQLVTAALDDGASDNVTVIVARVLA
jgi:serine/threonine protein phosphatase PrpC